MPGGYAFEPVNGGPVQPLSPYQEAEVFIPVSGIDPNLLLFGFGVLALLGICAYLAYLASKKK